MSDEALDPGLADVSEGMSGRPTVSIATDPGPHAVRIADRELRDEARGLTLPIRLYYPALPEGAEPVPLPAVVFSHGLGGSKFGYAFLGRSWASHGFVSIHPTHAGTDAGLLGKGRVESLRAMKAAVADPRNWEARARDVSFLLGAAPALGDLVPALQGRIDGERLGVAGHSYGAYAALLVAGARVQLPGRRADFFDARCSAAIAMSPPGPGDRGLDAEALAGIRTPLLCMTGSDDLGLRGQPAAWREETFRGAPPGDKWLVFLEGGEHFTFSGGRPRRPAAAAQVVAIERATRAFLRATLLRDPASAVELRGLASPLLRIEQR